MTICRRPEIRAVLMALVLAGLLTLPSELAAEVTSQELTVDVGGAKIHLLNPSGLIRIDGSGPEADEVMTIYQDEFKDQGKDLILLAFYIEPKNWENYKKAVSQPGSSPTLDYLAFIAVPSKYVKISLSIEDFQKWLTQLADDDQLKDCERGERYITCKNDVVSDYGLMSVVTTHMLVEGKFLVLNTLSSPNNQFADQFAPTALKWRDKYLEITRP